MDTFQPYREGQNDYSALVTCRINNAKAKHEKYGQWQDWNQWQSKRRTDEQDADDAWGQTDHA
eukprot:6115604-Karenia_brevis.AAC.1